MEVKILGTKYKLILNAKTEEYPKLKRCDGYTDFSIKEIVVADFEKDPDTIDDIEFYKKKVLRHEIVHAYLYESGLSENSDWARNEELVDWVAMQFEKLLSTFIELNCISNIGIDKGEPIKIDVGMAMADITKDTINTLNKAVANIRIGGGG